MILLPFPLLSRKHVNGVEYSTAFVAWTTLIIPYTLRDPDALMARVHAKMPTRSRPSHGFHLAKTQEVHDKLKKTITFNNMC
jgi:hypothetical protein